MNVTDYINPKGYIENFLINILSLLIRFCFFMEKNFSNDRQLGIFLSSIRKERISNRLMSQPPVLLFSMWCKWTLIQISKIQGQVFRKVDNVIRWIYQNRYPVGMVYLLRFRWIVIYLSCGLGKKLVRWSGATNQLLPVVVLAMQKDT